LTAITCSFCGGNVYEYGRPSRSLEKAVLLLSGCTAYSCYRCGGRGWLRYGRSNIWIVTLARTICVLISLLAAIVIAIVIFGFLTL
jgi:hypothetical protein